MLRYLRDIATWLLPPFVVFALPTDAPGLTCLAMIYLYLGGLFLAFVFVIRFFATCEKPPAAAGLLLVVVLWVFVWHFGFTTGASIHLLVNERRYMKTIAELSGAKSPEEKDRICADDCIAHSNGVIVFHYCHCPFNWPDIVYDPENTLDAPRDELQRISLYLHRSERLSKSWYIGYFAD